LYDVVEVHGLLVCLNDGVESGQQLFVFIVIQWIRFERIDVQVVQFGHVQPKGLPDLTNSEFGFVFLFTQNALLILSHRQTTTSQPDDLCVITMPFGFLLRSHEPKLSRSTTGCAQMLAHFLCPVVGDLIVYFKWLYRTAISRR
jgi:hypothetical protein